MATRTNAKNLRQFRSRFSLVVEQILAYASSTNWVTEVKSYVRYFLSNFCFSTK